MKELISLIEKIKTEKKIYNNKDFFDIYQFLDKPFNAFLKDNIENLISNNFEDINFLCKIILKNKILKTTIFDFMKIFHYHDRIELIIKKNIILEKLLEEIKPFLEKKNRNILVRKKRNTYYIEISESDLLFDNLCDIDKLIINWESNINLTTEEIKNIIKNLENEIFETNIYDLKIKIIEKFYNLNILDILLLKIKNNKEEKLNNILKLTIRSIIKKNKDTYIKKEKTDNLTIYYFTNKLEIYINKKSLVTSQKINSDINEIINKIENKGKVEAIVYAKKNEINSQDDIEKFIEDQTFKKIIINLLLNE